MRTPTAAAAAEAAAARHPCTADLHSYFPLGPKTLGAGESTKDAGPKSSEKARDDTPRPGGVEETWTRQCDQHSSESHFDYSEHIEKQHTFMIEGLSVVEVTRSAVRARNIDHVLRLHPSTYNETF
jgi:hypothetical protein